MDRDYHQIFTAAEIKEESVVPEAYLCESCWKISITFYTKEVSIKECIKKGFTILPTTEVNCEGRDMTQSEHVSMSEPVPASQSLTPTRKRCRLMHPKANKRRRTNARMKVSMQTIIMYV